MININIQNPINNSTIFIKNLKIKYNVEGLDLNVNYFIFLINNKKYIKTEYNDSFFPDSLVEGKNNIIVYAVNKNNKKIEYTEKQINFKIIQTNINYNTKLSLLTKTIIPEFILSDYSQFTTFIQKYYEFLETSNTPYLTPFKQFDFYNIDTTSDYFFPYFYSQFLPDFPKQLAIDTQTGTPLDITKVIKNIKKFYESKGSINSYKFLFRILFDTEIDIEYPREQILKASGGNWVQRKSIKIFCFNDNLNTELNNRFVYQLDEFGNKISSAKVFSIETYRTDQYKITELFIEDYVGNFDKNKKLLCDTIIDGAKETLEFYLAYCPVKINILQSGYNYKINDRVILVPKKFINIDSGDFSNITDFDYIIDGLNFNSSLPISYFVFDGGNFVSQFFDPSSILTFGKGYLGKVSRIGKQGEILEIDAVNFGFNYELNINELYDVIIESNNGTGFTGSSVSEIVCEYTPFFSGNGGKLSSTKVIQDNDYYQSHSYQINTEVDISLYHDNIKKLVHPSGYKLFGKNIINRKSKENFSTKYTIEELNG